MKKLNYMKECSGCHACYNICPTQSIKMKHNREGFLYPHIEEGTCINCNQCERICPVLQPYQGNAKGRAYACINSNEKERMMSSSGGIFSVFAEKILNEGGVVFGAAFDHNWNVQHIEVSSVSELEKLRGSKYLQSVIGDCFQKVKTALESGKTVLFTGTPCQISGLKAFLGKEYQNLIMQDIICHGVPSSKIWRKYLKFKEEETKAKIEKVFFRYKKDSWKNFRMRLEFSNGEVYEAVYSDDMYMQGFLKNFCLRPSCYQCHAKSIQRESDLTLADFWGIERILPKINDDKGISLVLINSQKGQNLFDECKEKINSYVVDIDEAIKYNSPAQRSVSCPTKRDNFMECVDKVSFDQAIKKYVIESPIRSVARRGVQKIKRILKGRKR